MTEFELTQDLTAVDEVSPVENWTGHTVTLAKGTRFYMIIPRHPSSEFPETEFCLIVSEGKMYLPVANQLKGKYKEAK